MDYIVVKEYLTTVIKKDKSYVFLLLLVSLFGAGVTTIDTLLIKYVIDSLVYKSSVNDILGVLAFGVGSSMLLSLVNGWVKQMIEYKNSQLVSFFEVRIANKIMCLKYEDIDNPQILERKDKALFPVRNQNAIAVFLSNFLNIIQSILSIVSLCIILIALDIWIILIIFMIIAVDILIFKKIQEAEYELFDALIEDNRELNYYKNITTDFKYAKDIRIFGFSDLIFQKINNYIDMSTKKFAKANLKVGKNSSLSSILGVFRNAVVYGYIAYKVYLSEIGIGSFSMYVQAVNSFSELISTLFLNVIEMKQYCKFLYPYFEFEKMQSTEDAFGELALEDSFGIVFENVSFRYPNQDKYALKNVSFSINNQEVVSLVGTNGSGKTTLIKLICGLYQPTEGKILVNGKNIADYKNTDLINNLAVVFQDYKIFASSILENVVFENKPEDKDISSALDSVGLKQFVEELPQKEDTQLTKLFYSDGIELSGGMEQRLAIARAICKKHKVLILDEPTSSLDPVMENMILKDMRNLASNKTTIFVSHSMSSCIWVDKIIVMKDGCVEEIGRHKELLESEGEYHRLFSMQSSLYM